MGSKSFLRDGELKLRTVEEEDMELLQEILNKRDKRPVNLVNTENYFEEKVCEKKPVQLIVRFKEEDKGMIELKNIQGDQGYSQLEVTGLEGFEKDFWKRAVEMFVDYAFKKLRLHRICSKTFEWEDDLKGLLTEIGFQDEGVNEKEEFRRGGYRDVRYLSVLEGEWLQ